MGIFSLSTTFNKSRQKEIFFSSNTLIKYLI